MNKTRLEARIAARNLANASALKYGPIIIAALTPLVGTAIKLQTGCKSAKLEKILDALNLPNGVHGDGSIQVHVRVESHWFRVEFRTCVHATTSCVYESQTVNLGDLDGKVLKAVCAPPSPTYCRTDYTAEEILASRAAVRSVRDELHAAESRLAGFGEHDN